MTPRYHRDTTRDMVLGVGVILVLFVGILSVFLLPLPVLAYRLKLGRAKGAAVATIAFAAMAAILGGGAFDLLTLLALLMLGFIFGECFERNFPLEKTMMMACGTLILGYLLALFYYSHATGVGVGDLISAYVEKNLALYKAAVNEIKAAEETKQALLANIDSAEGLMLKLLPGIVVSGILFHAWIILLLARPVFRRMGLAYPDFGRLNRWQAPEMLVWALIGCGLMILMPGGTRLIGLNGLLVVAQIYFFQGIAIVSFFFGKQRIPPIIRGILYILIFVQPFLLILVTGLSIFDMWLNVRKIPSNPGD